MKELLLFKKIDLYLQVLLLLISTVLGIAGAAIEPVVCGGLVQLLFIVASMLIHKGVGQRPFFSAYRNILGSMIAFHLAAGLLIFGIFYLRFPNWVPVGLISSTFINFVYAVWYVSMSYRETQFAGRIAARKQWV